MEDVCGTNSEEIRSTFWKFMGKLSHEDLSTLSRSPSERAVHCLQVTWD